LLEIPLSPRGEGDKSKEDKREEEDIDMI